MTNAQKFARVFGAIYVLVGILGFIPAVGGSTSQTGNELLGIFGINLLHNVVHIAVGAAFLVGSSSDSAARSISIAIGVVYLLVVGAGGLGSPALYYLAAAGVGELGIVDFDSVEENNLQRQIIHSTSRIGDNKAASAKSTIEDLNPNVRVETIEDRLSKENVDAIVSRYDLVIDATDNFDTRYLLNEAAVKHGKPYVYGSIFRFEGYASVFWPERGGPCYRCMHPEPPPASLAPT